MRSRALGERESGTARLEEAVAAYRAALEEMHARARAARMGDDAGRTSAKALSALGEREERDGAAGGGRGDLEYVPDRNRGCMAFGVGVFRLPVCERSMEG